MAAEVLPHMSIYGLDDDGPELRLECWCHACGKLVSTRIVDVSQGEPTNEEAVLMAELDAELWNDHLRAAHPDAGDAVS